MTAVLLIGGIAGCASTSEMRANTEEPQWWAVRFRVHWPEGQPPRFYLDDFLADQVVGPVLNRYGKDISLWRFHRRARRDGAGHQFSVLMFATSAVATAAYQSMHGSAALQLLERSGDIEHVVLTKSPGSAAATIAGTSDKHWSMPLQKAWPWFIMGASRSWLSLVQQARASLQSASPKTAEAMNELYRRVDQAVTAQWHDYAAHAYMHHLNAIFGYEPFQANDGKVLVRF